MKPDLLFVCATSFEVSSFLARCPGKASTITRAGLTLFSGQLHSTAYDLLITGPGVFNAAHALSAYLEHVSNRPGGAMPDMVVQIGIAGGFKDSGMIIGDIGVAESEHYIHTGVADSKTALPFDLIKDRPATRTGEYFFDASLVGRCADGLVKNQSDTSAAIRKGKCLTVSTITGSFGAAAKLYAQYNNPVMEAMEGAASAHVCTLYNIPMIEIRSASNFAGERNKVNWDFDLALENLGWACTAVLGEACRL